MRPVSSNRRPFLFARRIAVLAFLAGLIGAGRGTAAAPARAASADDPPVAAPVPEPRAGHRLAYRFSPGQTVYYETVHTSKLTTRKGELSETVDNETRARKHFRVVSVADDGSATLELMFDRIQMSVRFGNGEPVALDTAKPDECPPAYRGIVQTIGKPLARVRISTDGKLLESESLLASAVDAEVTGPSVRDPSPSDDPGKNVLIPFPSEPVAVGETWTDSFTTPVYVTRKLKRDVKILRKYTLRSIEGPLARISIDTVAVTPLREPAIRAQLLQREPSGTIDFDLERGVIVARQATIDKTVLAAFGDDTSMHAESLMTERLVEGERVAQRKDD
jgi:hypothetical protein